MSQAPSIVVVVKITIDDTWDARHQALFGSAENYAENLCTMIVEKDLGDAAEVVTVEVVKPTH